MQSTDIRVVSERRGGVAVVTMTRPSRRNAMSGALVEDLLRELASLAAEPSVRAVVITGAGGAFSAGADLTEELDRDQSVRRMALFGRLYETLVGFAKVTVAAIEGAAVGGGAEVASACDLRVGARTCRIKFPGAELGIPIGSARLPLLVGLSHAKDLLLTSRFIDGEEAFRMGFLNRLVPDGRALDEAVALAQETSARPAAALQKRAMDESHNLLGRTRAENRLVDRSRVTP